MKNTPINIISYAFAEMYACIPLEYILGVKLLSY